MENETEYNLQKESDKFFKYLTLKSDTGKTFIQRARAVISINKPIKKIEK